MKAGIYGSNPGNVRNFRKYQFVNMYYSYLFTEVLVKIADTSVSFYVWTKIWIDFYGSNDQNEQKTVIWDIRIIWMLNYYGSNGQNWQKFRKNNKLLWLKIDENTKYGKIYKILRIVRYHAW